MATIGLSADAEAERRWQGGGSDAELESARSIVSTEIANDPLRDFPRSGLIRIRTIKRHWPVDDSTIWRGVKNKTWPAPCVRAPKLTAWDAGVMYAFLRSKLAVYAVDNSSAKST